MADLSSIPRRASKRSRRLRIIGVLVLLAGIGGAGLVYWMGTRSPDVMNDLSMVGFNNARRRQMGNLYGKMGLMLDQFLDDLKQPGTQAELLIAISILAAAGCFYFARLTDHSDLNAGDFD